MVVYFYAYFCYTFIPQTNDKIYIFLYFYSDNNYKTRFDVGIFLKVWYGSWDKQITITQNSWTFLNFHKDMCEEFVIRLLFASNV